MDSKLKIFESNYAFFESIANTGNTYVYLTQYVRKIKPSDRYFQDITLFRNCTCQNLVVLRKYCTNGYVPKNAVLITEYKLVDATIVRDFICGDKVEQKELEWDKVYHVNGTGMFYQFNDANGNTLLELPKKALPHAGWIKIFNEIIQSNKNKSSVQHIKNETSNVSRSVVASNNKKVNDNTNKSFASRSANTRKDIEDTYNELLDILRDAKQDVSELEGVNSSFNSIKRTVLEVLNAQTAKSKNELSKTINETVWDNLVIAFFGETNAGKSTIIETFRILFDKNRKKEDGLIVGDGRHDFTKIYEEYKMSIGGHNFTLIDVPGIEGNEDDFKDVIKTALHKAHCVFYIQGHNKKPDEATAKKIKKYLGDWVKVYSVYNVRGGAGNYDEEEERETLLTDGIKKIESLIQAEFKRILGDVYAGHITLQALLAMSAKATFSKQREDLIKTQQKLIKYFGSSDKVLEYSQFKTVTNLVEQKSANFKAEIIEANKQKLISLANKVAKDISSAMEEQKYGVEKLKDNLKVVEREVCNNYLDTAYRNIQNKSKNVVDRIYGELKQYVYELIDRESGSNSIRYQVNYRQRDLLSRLRAEIINIVREEMSRASNKANRKIKELDGIRLSPISFRVYVDINSEIDFSGALSELDIDFDDVVGWATKTASTAAAGAALGSFIPGIGTMIGATVGGVFGGLVHAVSGDGGKSDAKKSVSDAIGKAKTKAKKDIENALRPVLYEIGSQKKKLKDTARLELSNIEDLVGSIDSFDDDIENFVKELKNNGYGRI